MSLESLLPKNSYSARLTFTERLAGLISPTVRYLFTIESHAYAMAIAGSVLLGFFPFMVLILSLSQNLFAWRDAVDAIYVGLRDLLPNDPGLVDFVERNLRAAVRSRGRVESVSVLLLIFSANGIFMPLEVALNRLWGFPGNRSYWLNQLISFSLTFTCGVLALTAAVLTSANVAALQQLLTRVPLVPERLTLLALKAAAIPFSILIFLLVYWLLPNGKVTLRAVWPIAVLAAVVIELAKNLYVWLWPMLGLRNAYGPFFISVTLLLWGFFAALIVLGGAEMCARRARWLERQKQE
ncbi:MAG: YihY/virulence factor BrkB family protein [Bryobacterales bacterium]